MANQFNLLPWREERRIKKLKNNQFSLVAAAIVGVLCSLGYYGYEKVRLDDHEKALNVVKQANKQLDIKLKEKKKLDELKALLNKQIDAIEALQDDRSSASHMVEELSLANIQELFLSRFSLKDGKVDIAGTAENDAEIADLMKKLRQSQWYQEPQLIEIVSNSDNGGEIKDFKITSQLLLPGSNKQQEENN